MGAHREPARIHRVRAGGPSRGVTTHRFLAYTFPSRSPRPAHPAVLGRRDFVEAAPTLPGDPQVGLPPALLCRYDGIEMDGLPPPSGNNSSASWRTPARSTDPPPRESGCGAWSTRSSA